VFFQLGVNCELVIDVCYYPRSRSLQVRESDDCDFVVYCVCIMEASCMFYFIAPTVMKLKVLYYGFIASFIG